MSSRVRRFGLLGGLLALVLVMLPATVAATTSSEIDAAEATALSLINEQRANGGLVALRLDSRLATIAGKRAAYMASTGVFSHTQNDGTTAFSMISDAGITWYGAGEIIAWHSGTDIQGSAAYAVQSWMGSDGHRAIIMSNDYNYVGFGLAVASNGRRYWAGVFLKGPDRTGAWASIGSVGKSTAAAGKVRVTLHWSGADTRLQVLTAGLRDFSAQGRWVGGPWVDYGTLSTTSMTRDWLKGTTYQFRVRARDKNGNWGGWQYVTVKP